MRRIHTLSDLHLDFSEFTPPETEADIVILAGDIRIGTKGVRWAKSAFGLRPVIYVPGNHDGNYPVKNPAFSCTFRPAFQVLRFCHTRQAYG